MNLTIFLKRWYYYPKSAQQFCAYCILLKNINSGNYLQKVPIYIAKVDGASLGIYTACV